ncbi:MAG: GNAT family N-acetyltransferase [Candidatus Latescibacteria bacterium]|nr:GNAT family N-acetyltransferase [Candidatus Latescibacterota bacterium]
MATLEPISSANALLLKSVRLRALQDTPTAFGSTYAREAAFTDTQWQQRASRHDGRHGIGYLVMDQGEPCGIAGSFIDRNANNKTHLVSMWVASSHRRRGLGRQLVEAIVSWAASKGIGTLYLLVTATNKPAIAFYRGLSFALTGYTEPHPNYTDLEELEMARIITTH